MKDKLKEMEEATQEEEDEDTNTSKGKKKVNLEYEFLELDPPLGKKEPFLKALKGFRIFQCLMGTWIHK